MVVGSTPPLVAVVDELVLDVGDVEVPDEVVVEVGDVVDVGVVDVPGMVTASINVSSSRTQDVNIAMSAGPRNPIDFKNSIRVMAMGFPFNCHLIIRMSMCRCCNTYHKKITQPIVHRSK